MFKIGSKDPYSTVKIHFTNSIEIANEVIAELSNRFSETFDIITDEDSDSCMWDPGGMLWTGDEIFDFNLDNITLRCRAQHFNYFLDALEGCDVRGKNTHYHKLHGRWYCVCISTEEFSQLKKLVENPELFAKANEAEERRESALNACADSGKLVRVKENSEAIEDIAKQKYKGLN